MSLKVELKPRERLIVGDSIITNGGQRTRILIDGDAPILREKDIMTPISRCCANWCRRRRAPGRMSGR